MPKLRQISCSIELSDTPYTEHRTRYRDGAVECYIATIDSNLPFTIHVLAEGHIASGVAVFVFIDGVYQCNRNLPCSSNQSIGSSPTGITAEFRLRQKEEKLPDGTFVGREWSFTELIKADKSAKKNKQYEQNVGSIEVIILRCQYADSGLTTIAPQKPSQVPAHNTIGTKATPTKTAPTKTATTKTAPAKAAPLQASSVKAISKHGSKVKDDTDDVFGSSLGLGGLLDGVADFTHDEPPHYETEHTTDSTDSDPMTARSVSHRSDLVIQDDFKPAPDHDHEKAEDSQQDVWHVENAQMDGGGSDKAQTSKASSSTANESRQSSMSSSSVNIKPYWNTWDKAGVGRITTGIKHSEPQRARQVYVYPALPTPAVSSLSKVEADRGVQIGRGATYGHKSCRPEYLDTMEAPYAVFTFKYCSHERLEKILGRKIGYDMQDVIAKAEKERLMAMSKEEMAEELMRLRLAGTEARPESTVAGDKRPVIDAHHARSSKPSRRSSKPDKVDRDASNGPSWGDNPAPGNVTEQKEQTPPATSVKSSKKSVKERGFEPTTEDNAGGTVW